MSMNTEESLGGMEFRYFRKRIPKKLSKFHNRQNNSRYSVKLSKKSYHTPFPVPRKRLWVDKVVTNDFYKKKKFIRLNHGTIFTDPYHRV